MSNHYEYTEGQMTSLEEQIESDLKKFKLPPITRAYKLWGLPLFNKTLIPFSFIIMSTFMFYECSYDAPEWMWMVSSILLFIYFPFFAGFAILSYIKEKTAIYRFRRKMKLSKTDFDIFCATYNITGL